MELHTFSFSLFALSFLYMLLALQGCGGGDHPTPSPTPLTPDQEIVQTFRGKNLLWGAASAAAQIEGGWNASDKQPSIWDDFCHNISAKTGDTSFAVMNISCGHGEYKSNLDVTDDFFHKYENDIDMLAELGFTSFRVSISWPRVMPLVKGVRQKSTEGINFYKAVFAKLKSKNIVPFVTMFHWDLPNDLSWLHDNVTDAFVDYAEVLLKEFGDIIMNWATFNEPASFCNAGYNSGWFAPGHVSRSDHLVCSHHVLQAHARTVKLFREKYNQDSKSQIGIILDYKWAYPATDSEDDKRAASNDRDRVFGIYADPIFLTGDYPKSLKDFFGEHLPAFTSEEKGMLKGSADFYGANLYGGKVAIWTNQTYLEVPVGYQKDMTEIYSKSPCDPKSPELARSKVKNASFECGSDSSWLWTKPDAMRQYLEYIHTRYNPPSVYVTEFGTDVKGETLMPKEQALHDTFRQEYYSAYLVSIATAEKNGVPIKGVFAWSMMDNLEWHDGLYYRFGIVYVDFNSLTRTPKDSAKWWSRLVKNITAPDAIVV